MGQTQFEQLSVQQWHCVGIQRKVMHQSACVHEAGSLVCRPLLPDSVHLLCRSAAGQQAPDAHHQYTSQ